MVSVSVTLHVPGFNLQYFHLSLPGVDVVFCLKPAVLRAPGNEEQKLQTFIGLESSGLLETRQKARGENLACAESEDECWGCCG